MHMKSKQSMSDVGNKVTASNIRCQLHHSCMCSPVKAWLFCGRSLNVSSVAVVIYVSEQLRKVSPPQRRCHSSPVNGAQDPGCTLIEGPNGGLGGAFSLGERGEKQTITSCKNWSCVTDLTYILSRSLYFPPPLLTTILAMLFCKEASVQTKDNSSVFITSFGVLNISDNLSRLPQRASNKSSL